MSKFKEERDKAAQKFAKNWAKPPPEKAELEALEHAHSKGWDKCLESSVVKSLVDALVFDNQETRDQALNEYSEALAEIRGEK